MSHPFNPALTTKSVHDTLEAAYAAIPDGTHRAVLIDASTDAGVRRVPGGWHVALGGSWDGREHIAGKVAVLKAG